MLLENDQRMELLGNDVPVFTESRGLSSLPSLSGQTQHLKTQLRESDNIMLMKCKLLYF